MVVVHSAANDSCNQHMARLKPDYWDLYSAQGLAILLVITEDELGRTDDISVLKQSYAIKSNFGFDFPVVADPGAKRTGQYFQAQPLTLLVDKDEVIRNKVEGRIPDPSRMGQYITDLLNK